MSEYVRLADAVDLIRAGKRAADVVSQSTSPRDRAEALGRHRVLDALKIDLDCLKTHEAPQDDSVLEVEVNGVRYYPAAFA